MDTDLVFHRDVVGYYQTRAIYKADFGRPEECLEVFCLRTTAQRVQHFGDSSGHQKRHILSQASAKL